MAFRDDGKRVLFSMIAVHQISTVATSDRLSHWMTQSFYVCRVQSQWSDDAFCNCFAFIFIKMEFSENK